MTADFLFGMAAGIFLMVVALLVGIFFYLEGDDK